MAAYGEEVEALAAAPRYREPVKALTCYKGNKHLSALAMITEIGDVKCFAHPRQLVSRIGMDIREYASEGQIASLWHHPAGQSLSAQGLHRGESPTSSL